MPERLILATRGSRLALAQSEAVRRDLCRLHPGLRVDLLTLKTEGDRVLDRPLSEIPGKGLFTREIELALLDGRAHLAVHSLKDMPVELPAGLVLAAMPGREDPRDVLVCREAKGLDELPPGARIGTGSPRREAQLAHCRPDLSFSPLRGNVETRLRKLSEDKLDAIVLAGAGLIRLGLADRITQWLSPQVMVPAAGQGIIAVEARSGDAATLGLLAALDCPLSRACAAAERGALLRLGGGCRVPVGILARVEGDRCTVDGVALGPAGTPCYRARVSGAATEAETVGGRLAEELLGQGAAELLEG